MTDDMTEDQKRLDYMLHTDPLDVAEKITGNSYKDDSETRSFGMSLLILHNEAKEKMLVERSDSYYNMDFEPARQLFLDLGFVEIYQQQFEGRCGDDDFVILWHPDGILATCESYGAHRNTANIYFNFRPNEGESVYGLHYSGGRTESGVLVASHDVREGLRHTLSLYRSKGVFLPVWEERPFLWLVNYAEDDALDFDYRAINESKIGQLPIEIQKAISPEVAE